MRKTEGMTEKERISQVKKQGKQRDRGVRKGLGGTAVSTAAQSMKVAAKDCRSSRKVSRADTRFRNEASGSTWKEVHLETSEREEES